MLVLGPICTTWTLMIPGVLDKLLRSLWRRRQRRLGTCPVCDEPVRALDAHVNVHGVRIHRECQRFRPRFAR